MNVVEIQLDDNNRAELKLYGQKYVIIGKKKKAKKVKVEDESK